MANFASVYKHLLGGQLVIRIVSFLLNFVLLRLIDPSLLGFFNVKMTLLYNTICFLSREPIRRLCLSSDFPLHNVPLYASLSPLFALATLLLCSVPWAVVGAAPPPALGIGRATNALIVALFGLSAFAETFAEPAIVCQLKMGNTADYAKNNAILVLSQKAIAFVAVLFGLGPLLVFPMAQLIGSFIFVCLHCWPWSVPSSSSFSSHSSPSSSAARLPFPLCSLHLFEATHLKLLATFMCHSLVKQTLTDGANYLMSFTDLLPLKMQAIYDAVERLGSLAVRLVLQPFEETASIYFGTHIRRTAADGRRPTDAAADGDNVEQRRLLKRHHHTGDEVNNSDDAAHRPPPPSSAFAPAVPAPICAEFLLLTRLILTLGAVLLTFGSSFCWLAAFLYGGKLFIDNGADTLLFWYSVYLPLIAVNGISECFVIATLNASQLLVHARFFFLLSLCLHLPLSYALCSLFGALGFLFANLAVYSLRVLFNWHFFINRILCSASAQFLDEDNSQPSNDGVRQTTGEMYKQMLPGRKFTALLCITWFVLSMSRTFLGQTLAIPSQVGHLLVGAAAFCIIAFAFLSWERKFLMMLNFGHKKLQ